jgi:GMP synthase (glutamine-hydrolysing)
MKPLLLLQTGSPPDEVVARHGDFDAMFLRMGNLIGKNIVVLNVERGQKLDAPSAYSGALITGSYAMVTDHEAWSERTAEWIRDAFRADLPMFGVCYGHQLMAYALGGDVDYLADGIEFGTHTLTLADDASRDPLLHDLPKTFDVNVLHSQTVSRLPDGTQVLASTRRDPHQILRYSDTALSVQFHPEFDGASMQTFVRLERANKPELPDQRGDDTPVATGLMGKWIEAVCNCSVTGRGSCVNRVLKSVKCKV